jgi:hypothetical protein
MRCSECKCCEAQESMAEDPKPLCVFCEDGVPCLGRQRAVRSVVTPAPAKLLAPPQQRTPRKPRNPNSPWRGNAGLHLSDNAPAKPAPSNSAVALQDEAVQPQQVVEVPTAGIDRQEEKKEITVKPPRICACKPGCTEIAKSNASPYAKGHNPNPKSKPAKRKKAQRGSKATPPRNSTARVETPSTAIATICVTEAHMDTFWSKLSLEEKANVFQRQLEGA